MPYINVLRGKSRAAVILLGRGSSHEHTRVSVGIAYRIAAGGLRGWRRSFGQGPSTEECSNLWAGATHIGSVVESRRKWSRLYHRVAGQHPRFLYLSVRRQRSGVLVRWRCRAQCRRLVRRTVAGIHRRSEPDRPLQIACRQRQRDQRASCLQHDNHVYADLGRRHDSNSAHVVRQRRCRRQRTSIRSMVEPSGERAWLLRGLARRHFCFLHLHLRCQWQRHLVHECRKAECQRQLRRQVAGIQRRPEPDRQLQGPHRQRGRFIGALGMYQLHHLHHDLGRWNVAAAALHFRI